jgi:outer membrane protein assembly factor BamB
MHVAAPSIAWLALALLIGRGDESGWTRWGGPSGDFVLAGGPELVDAWPETGPKVLWNRELGDGYSAILCRDGRLFTMYRDGEVEIVTALQAATGEVIWDFAYEAGRYADMSKAFGEGPNATPLLVGDRLVSIGVTGKLTCLEADSGDPAWELDLHERFGRQTRREEYGYSGSPLAYDGKVLVLVGGEKYAVVAFDPRDGSVAWASAPGRVSYAPPRLLRIAKRDHFVYFSPTEVIGMAPEDGSRLWSYPVECVTENNLTSVVQCSDQHLWVACQLDGGTRVLAITEKEGKWTSEALWTSRTLKQGHWHSIALGDHVYGSLGDATSMFGAVNWRTGETTWKERGFHAAQLVRADGKLVIVAESGEIALARVSPAGLEVLCSHPILESVAWTAPTLVGTTLYARDRKRIVALDLAKSSYEKE